jgi:nitrite reductase/ring-hydroxylating ferredoxin subunit
MSFGPGWYAVAISQGLAPGTSAGTRLFDREIVLWRDQDGAAHAWEDRCPHRGMRLSFGFVRGNHIACLYHGWQYGPEGQCRYIPAHPQLAVPSTIRVTTHACRERLGMAWIHSAPETEGPPPLPGDDSAVTPVRSLYVDRAPDAVLADLMAGRIAAIPVGHDGEKRPSDIELRAGSLLAFRVGEQPIIAALQPYGARKTALHLVIAAATSPAPARKRIALWAEALRRALEANTDVPEAAA